MKRNVNTKLRSADAQTKRFGLGMLSPTVVILLIMTAYPLFFTLVYSFTDYNLLRSLKKGSHFIALQNYTKLLSDPYFQQSILNTVKFTILAVIFEMFIGLVMALFVNSLKRGLSVEGCTASEPQRILDALADGKLVVALMTKGHFTKSGHFIVLRGVQDEKILVADPASYRRSQKAWD